MPGGRRHATYRDVVEAPEHLVAEVIEGELITTPRPAPQHALAGSAIASVLFDRFNGPPGGAAAPGGWWILFEPELHLGDDVLVPDLAGWRRARMSALPAAAFFERPPDWACEVVSATSGRLDRTRKMPIYAREGVGWMWLVDPIARTLEVHRLESERWVVIATYGGGAVVRAAPFEAVEVDTRRWWGDA